MVTVVCAAERERPGGQPAGPEDAGRTPLARAQRIRVAKERSARAGRHQGPAPLGYRRVSRCPTVSGAPMRGVLLPDPVYAPIVREIFVRYAAGGWSHIRLVEWLNGAPCIPPPPHRVEWTCATIQALLRNPIYCGLVRYNHRPEGRYTRAAPGSAFLAQGRHPALIDAATFARVAERRAAAFTRPSYARHAPPVGAGVFVCVSCGGPMTPSHQEPGLVYRCSWRQRRKGNGAPPHTAPAYAGGLAEEALLREVRRLRAAPWTAPPAPDAREARASAAHVPATDSARLRGVGVTQTAEVPEVPKVLEVPEVPKVLEVPEVSGDSQADLWPDARTRHAQLVATPLPPLVDGLLTRGDVAGLRRLVREVVASARIVERRPERRSTWLRAEVTWQPAIQALLDSGAAQLSAAAPPPEESPQAERRREAQRRYSTRRRQQLSRAAVGRALEPDAVVPSRRTPTPVSHAAR